MNDEDRAGPARAREWWSRMASGEANVTVGHVAVGLAAFSLLAVGLAYAWQRPASPPVTPATTAPPSAVQFAPPAPGIAAPLPSDAPSASATAELTAPPEADVLPIDSDAVIAAAPMPTVPDEETRATRAPLLVYDAGANAASDDAGATDGGRVISTPNRRPAVAAPTGTTAPARALLTRGTLIPSLLESTIDTAQPGSVRAMVTADVRSADGQRVLVPRASRLVGHYKADKRDNGVVANVVWTRIEMPEGRRVSLGADGGNFTTAPVVSQVSGQTARGSLRVRQGEPIRVFAARNVTLAE